MSQQRNPNKKKNPATRRFEKVRDVFDPDALKRICEAPAADFSAYAHRIDLDGTKSWRGSITDRFLYYRDTGSPILAVAHLDTVQDDRTCNIINTADGPLALSGALDDRLGAYVILEMLPKLGIQVDWLLTTDEEMAASTATDFYVDHKQYNWMIEFDRGGTDVVMYQYDNKETRKLVEASGARVGNGSYSDIADLDQLGCAGFNWGVGYYDYHSRRAHAWLNDTFSMVAKFMKFYRANATTHIEYVAKSHWSLAGDKDWCPECYRNLDLWGVCTHCGYVDEERDDDDLIDDGDEGAAAALSAYDRGESIDISLEALQAYLERTEQRVLGSPADDSEAVNPEGWHKDLSTIFDDQRKEA